MVMAAQGRQRSDGSLDATTIGAGTLGQRDKGGKPKNQAEAVIEPVGDDRLGPPPDTPTSARAVRGPPGASTGTLSSISGGSHAGAVSWGHHRPTPTRRDPWMNPSNPADQPLSTPPATAAGSDDRHHPRRLDRLERIRPRLGVDDDPGLAAPPSPADRLGRGLRAPPPAPAAWPAQHNASPAYQVAGTPAPTSGGSRNRRAAGTVLGTALLAALIASGSTFALVEVAVPHAQAGAPASSANAAAANQASRWLDHDPAGGHHRRRRQRPRLRRDPDLADLHRRGRRSRLLRRRWRRDRDRDRHGHRPHGRRLRPHEPPRRRGLAVAEGDAGRRHASTPHPSSRPPTPRTSPS